jgi:Sec-independent protein secretion pathway component TatC
MPAALAVEAVIVALGLCLFLPKSGLARGKSIALVLIVLMFPIIGMTITPPPPSASAMASSSLVTLVVVCGLIAWLGRVSREERSSASLSVNRYD